VSNVTIYKPSLLDKFKDFVNGVKANWDDYETHKAEIANKMKNFEILPTFFMVDFTTKCNMNCIYCLRHFEDSGEIIEEKVLTDICNYIIGYCKKYDVQEITFQPWGGEPLLALDRILLSKDIFEREGMRVNYSIQTNGLLLNRENFNILRENNISFGISIDGCDMAHDAQRVDLNNQKTHERLVNNIKNILEEDSSYKLSCISVNSKYTFEYIEESINYLVNSLGIRHLKFNLVHPNGNDFDKSILITPELVPEYVNKVFNSIVSQNDSGNICSETNISDKLLNILARCDGELCHTHGCLGGRRFVSFGSDGSIYPCELIGSGENCFGTIYNGVDLIEKIKLAIRTIPYFSKRKSEICQNCPYWFFCRGGCYVSAYSYGQNIGEIDEIECAVNQALYPKLIKLILQSPDKATTLLLDRIRINM